MLATGVNFELLFLFCKEKLLSKNKLWRVFVFVLLAGASTESWGQTANNYTYSTSTGVALEDFTTANSTSLLAACSDDSQTAVTNIGFNFAFEGATYTQFSVNTNGLLRLGGAQVPTSPMNTNFGTTSDGNPKITAAWDDFYLNVGTGTTDATYSWVRYKVIGSSPNRILVTEWRVRNYNSTEYDNAWCGWGSNSNDFNKRFQVWLYESGGAIEFRYGAGSTFPSSSIGISGATGTNYLSVNSGTHAASNTAVKNDNTTWPGNGRMYRFVGCTTPTNNTTTTAICAGETKPLAGIAGSGNTYLDWTIQSGGGTITGKTATAGTYNSGTYTGSVTIRYNVTGGCYADQTFTVQPTPIAPTIQSITNP